MKNSKRIISAIMALGMMAGCCACNNRQSGKTIVKIVNYEGGYGVDWLYEAKERFQAENSNIVLDINTTKTPNASTMNSSASDLYFGGQGGMKRGSDLSVCRRKPRRAFPRGYIFFRRTARGFA